MSVARQAAEKVTAAPLDLRLSLIFTPAAERAAQTALHAVYLELREVPHEARDPGVADVKLRWWEEEIDFLYAGKARHPLTQALQPHLAPLKGMEPQFRDLILGTRMDIAGAGMTTFEEVKRYCFRHSGALAELSAAIGGARSEEARLGARLLGDSACLADIATRGVAQALSGRLLFAAEDLKLHGIDRHIHGESQSTENVRLLMADYADRARTLQASAAMGVPAIERHALAVWQVRSALALARAHKQLRAGSARATEPVELHSLYALFIAWRAVRKVRQGPHG